MTNMYIHGQWQQRLWLGLLTDPCLTMNHAGSSAALIGHARVSEDGCLWADGVY